jgi:hypothetical protein
MLLRERPEDLTDFVIELDVVGESFLQDVIKRENVAMCDKDKSL